MGDVVSGNKPQDRPQFLATEGSNRAPPGRQGAGARGATAQGSRPRRARRPEGSGRDGAGPRAAGGIEVKGQGPESGSGREIALVNAAEGSRHEGLSVSSQKARGARVNSSKRMGKGKAKAKAGSRHDGAGAAMRRARGSTAIETRDRGAPGKARLQKSRGATVIGVRACQLIVTRGVGCFGG